VFVNGNGGVNLVVGQSASFVRQQRVGAGFPRSACRRSSTQFG
jgi:hypothetical protein